MQRSSAARIALACSLLFTAAACSREADAEATGPGTALTTSSYPLSLNGKHRRFLLVEGDVRIDGMKATVGHPVPQTALITVGKASRAVLTLEAGSIIRLGADTQASLGATARKQSSMKLLAGTIWSFFTRPTSYEVEGPNAVAGVRGTVFFVEAESKDSTYICDCTGEVEVLGLEGAGTPQTLVSKDEHKGVRIKTGSKTNEPVAAKNHTATEATELMKLLEQTK